VLILQVLPEVLRAYSIYRMLIYGFALVLLAVFRPQGLIAQGERLVGIGRRSLTDPPDSTDEAEAEAERQPEPATVAVPVRTPVLEASGLSCNFGGLAAVSNVSFAAYTGEILGIIGPNGAGKTTLFNLSWGSACSGADRDGARSAPSGVFGSCTNLPAHPPVRDTVGARKRPGRLSPARKQQRTWGACAISCACEPGGAGSCPGSQGPGSGRHIAPDARSFPGPASVVPRPSAG